MSKVMVLPVLTALAAAAATAVSWPPAGSCSNVTTRVDCGYSGITAVTCLARGCCFNGQFITNQCYRPAGTLDPPADWVDAVQANDMLFSANHVPAYNAPYVGNGFAGYTIGVPCGDSNCAMSPEADGSQSNLHDPATSLGGLFMAGVFNGIGNSTPSHRARLAAVHNNYLALPSDAASSDMLFYIGSALDLRRGMFLNRTALYTSTCTAFVEQRWYAHRANYDLLVHEVEVLNVTGQGCNVSLQPWFEAWSEVEDFNLTLSAGPAPTTVQGCTTLPEVPGIVNVTCVGLVYDPLPPSLDLAVSPTTVHRFLLVAHSSVELTGLGPAQLAHVSLANYTRYTAQSPAAQRQSHQAAWADLWQAGLEVGGNATVASTFNSTLYYILSSVRDDQPFGLSPGGLASNSYDGRSFWDTEIWMLPVLSMLHPDIGASLLEYRRARLKPAQLHAQWLGYEGAMYPWTSTLTGYPTTNDLINFDDNEQHITADIGLSLRLFYLTHTSQWPRAGSTFLTTFWQELNSTCSFWHSRMQPINISSSAVNYTVKHVIGPDESSGIVNDDCYTNGAAAFLMQFCIDVAPLINKTTPQAWNQQAARPYLPLNNQLYVRPVHSQYTGYSGGSIAQAAVALLQYPVGYTFDRQLMIDDLAYYESRTRSGDFYTGDSAYSIAWLALGNATAALNQWGAAFAHMDLDNFNVWHETTGYGHTMFLTGGGGYLQNLVQGWAGLRVGLPVATAPGQSQMILRPVLPPGVDLIRLRRLCYQQMAFDITFSSQATHLVSQVVRRDDSSGCAVSAAPGSTAAAILLVRADGGQWIRLLSGQNTTFTDAQEIGVWVFPGM